MRWQSSGMSLLVAAAWLGGRETAECWPVGGVRERGRANAVRGMVRRTGGGDNVPMLEKEEEKEVRVKVAVAELERPTQTATEVPAVSVGPTQPKIVVLGATGRVGRRVVRRLLSLDADLTVVAFVRSFERAIDVLLSPVDDQEDAVDANILDNVDVVDGDAKRQKYDSMFATVRRRGKGPKLRLVVTDLVQDDRTVYHQGSAPLPPFDFASPDGGVNSNDGDEEEDDGEELAVDYDDQDQDQSQLATPPPDEDSVDEQDFSGDSEDWLRVDASEALREEISSCTAIVSCLGTVRRTNVWTDVLRAPWGTRMFFSRSPDHVSKWCDDSRHPHYVNFKTTQRLLQMAEAEQERRDAAAEAAAEASAAAATGRASRNNTQPEKIKIIRISDLSVSRPAWSPTAVVTNLIRSMVFRYQEMAEIILQRSELVDTIVLRPGDLTDRKRDVNTTSLQVDASGILPPPAMVGRDDVAELAVIAALTRSDGSGVFSLANKRIPRGPPEARFASQRPRRRKPSTHQTWAVRWAGEELRQGTIQDGCRDARACVEKLLRERALQERTRRLSLSLPFSSGLLTKDNNSQRRRVKAYGVFAALAVYGVVWTLFLRHLHRPATVFLANLVGRRIWKA